MLESEMLAFIERSDALFPPLPPDAAMPDIRRAYDEYAAHFTPPRPAGLVVEDARLDAGGGPLPLRLYRPERDRRPGLVLFLHGGGFCVGSLDSHEVVTAPLALATGLDVVAVDYRLAPEHPAPAALEDSLAAARAALAGRLPFPGAGGPVILAGDSAGGNLAAGVALALRDRGVAGIAGMVLIYPMLGFEPALPARETQADAPLLKLSEVYYYRDLYLAGRAPGPYDFPLDAADLSNLPPCLAIGAEHDPLCDDAVAFARRLTAAGDEAASLVVPGIVHSSLRALGASPGVDFLFGETCRFIRTHIASRNVTNVA